ncbi:group II intron reverse transcriptase/maturase [Micromonospora soli]|uniref:group II intron reverse transcriptase/maturase n=1 Tax=Micromonospora sp. NBRC 110009 TaxID=3061627 RepID=UPI0026741AFA|nr:group II intron reverse transcriptase/maturase [Micromonospora sp. NBRC 110009]WKT96831.1 group II intron reverse transcriptase/maturase [Micromonospora sp. NBRC 110009]WKT98698.1 group II intron reverse transcriptase/maturase [Micromonospora sp. NBRC 110009]
MNTGAPWPSLDEAWRRVLEIQTKLHRWAGEDRSRRFDDLFNLVTDPAFLMVAWDRVRSNTGSRSAGVDGLTAHHLQALVGAEPFMGMIREAVRSGEFRPLPVRERLIPKPGSLKKRRLGIPTVADRVVQASLKLVLEPIFEADFHPCSFGFRPRRRAQDAIADIHLLTSKSYEWILEADIEACFDSIDHAALMARMRRRVGDKRVLSLVKAFLKAGILTETGSREETHTGTPQGGILSPLLANIALSVLDDFAQHTWQTAMSTRVLRAKRRRHGQPNWRLVRYADDFVILVHGERRDAEQLRDEVAVVLAGMGLRLSPAKTMVVHIDEGFDFLGFRIQRHRKRGTGRRCVYTYPSKKAVTAIKDKVRTLTHSSAQADLTALLERVNGVLRGWSNYFKHGVSKWTFSYLGAFTWHRTAIWIRKRHKGLTWKQLRRRFMAGGWTITDGQLTLFNPASVTVSRYRRRSVIPNPWTPPTRRLTQPT